MTGKSCLVGHCVNLLPIRTKVQPDATFQENLAAVKKPVLDAYDHHQSTVGEILQKVAGAAQPWRGPRWWKLFSTWTATWPRRSFTARNFPASEIPKRALHFDLFFNFVEGPRGLYRRV